MRNSLEILEEIRVVLKRNNLLTELGELEREIRASSTGDELCGRSAFKLLVLQQQSQEVNRAIGELITEFIAFCQANGIHIKDNK